MARELPGQVRPAGAASCLEGPRQQHRLEARPQRPGIRLGNTMMRRMIGRDKGFRCAGLVAGVKGVC